jgi:hypothetical protein
VRLTEVLSLRSEVSLSLTLAKSGSLVPRRLWIVLRSLNASWDNLSGATSSPTRLLDARLKI